MSEKFGKIFCLLILLQICFVSEALAQTDAVDKFVRTQLVENHIPGAAVAVVKNGKIVKLKGYGLASVEFQAPATPETVFEIGSVSKQITAAAILLLVEDGKIDLDEKISKYLPATPVHWKNVTVRNLLNHTSGIPSYTRLGGFELSKRYKVADFIKELGTHPLDFETGSEYRYNNSGYNLLSYIIESASGKSFWEFLRERIFLPLQMTKTADRDPQFVIRNRANGYEWEMGKLSGRDGNLTDLFGAGAIVSTVADLAKWDIALRGDKFLKKSSKDAMWTPLVLASGETRDYGLGWNVSKFRGQRLFSHGGQTAGFAANISRYVDADVSVIVLTNIGTSGAGTQIARGVAKIYAPALSLRALEKSRDATEDTALSARLQKAFEEIISGKSDSSDALHENLAKSFAAERSKEFYGRFAKFGAIEKFELIDAEENPAGGKTLRYRIEQPQRLALVRFMLDKNGKISALLVEEEE